MSECSFGSRADLNRLQDMAIFIFISPGDYETEAQVKCLKDGLVINIYHP